MKILIYGGASFIGTNLALRLAREDHHITLVDKELSYFDKEIYRDSPNIRFKKVDFFKASEVEECV